MLDRRNIGLIDLDGVLVDSEPLHGRSWLSTAVALGVAAAGIRVEEFRGVSEAGVAERLARVAGPTAPAAEEIVRLKQSEYEKLLPELQLVPGTMEFLESCRGAGVRLGLVTSGLRRNQEFVFRRFGLGHFFEAVVTGEDVARGKPAPEPYAKCLKLLGARAEQAFAVEDSVAGTTSAKAAGCLVVAVALNFPAEALREAGAEVVVADLAELLTSLPRLVSAATT